MKNFKFAAVNSKIDAMHSKFLMNENYITLARYERVDDILKYLIENCDIGKELDTKDSIYETEQKMKLYKFKQIEKLGHYFSDSYKDFSKAILSEFEVMDIKRVLRILQRGDKSTIKEEVLEFQNGYKIKIYAGMTIKIFVEKLRETRYYKALRAYQDELSDVILFYMEMNLDKLFYTDLVNITKSFDRKNKEVAKRLIGRKIDLLNVTWIYRGLKYYKLIPEELINFCIIGGYSLSYDYLRELCYCEDFKEVAEKILDSEYGFLYDSNKTDIYMDRRRNRFLYYNAKKEFRAKSSNVAKYISFLFLLEYEIKDITAIMEATRFDISLEETFKYMVRSYKESEL